MHRKHRKHRASRARRQGTHLQRCDVPGVTPPLALVHLLQHITQQLGRDCAHPCNSRASFQAALGTGRVLTGMVCAAVGSFHCECEPSVAATAVDGIRCKRHGPCAATERTEAGCQTASHRCSQNCHPPSVKLYSSRSTSGMSLCIHTHRVWNVL